MIIFDLDGTLANCEHRRHFVDPSKIPILQIGEEFDQKDLWKPDWRGFYDACDKDQPIQPVIEIYNSLHCSDFCIEPEIQIWSGRCESVRHKTISWFVKHGIYLGNHVLKMRSIGDERSQEELFEEWMDECSLGNIVTLKSEDKLDLKEPIYPIDFVFSNHAPTIAMFRRRGIFVFDCNQEGREF